MIHRKLNLSEVRATFLYDVDSGRQSTVKGDDEESRWRQNEERRRRKREE